MQAFGSALSSSGPTTATAPWPRALSTIETTDSSSNGFANLLHEVMAPKDAEEPIAPRHRERPVVGTSDPGEVRKPNELKTSEFGTGESPSAERKNPLAAGSAQPDTPTMSRSHQDVQVLHASHHAPLMASACQPAKLDSSPQNIDDLTDAEQLKPEEGTSIDSAPQLDDAARVGSSEPHRLDFYAETSRVKKFDKRQRAPSADEAKSLSINFPSLNQAEGLEHHPKPQSLGAEHPVRAGSSARQPAMQDKSHKLDDELIPEDQFAPEKQLTEAVLDSENKGPSIGVDVSASGTAQPPLPSAGESKSIHTQPPPMELDQLTATRLTEPIEANKKTMATLVGPQAQAIKPGANESPSVSRAEDTPVSDGPVIAKTETAGAIANLYHPGRRGSHESPGERVEITRRHANEAGVPETSESSNDPEKTLNETAVARFTQAPTSVHSTASTNDVRALQAASGAPGAAAGVGAMFAAGPSAGTVVHPPPSFAPGLEMQIQAPVYQPGFAQAMGTRITTLVKDGIERASIRLNPAEMGPVAVKLALEGTQVRVEMSADMAATRQVLEQALPSLAGALREAGFTLSGGGVFQQPQGQPGDDPSRQNGGRNTSAASQLDDRVGDALGPSSTRARVTDSLVDVFA